MQWKIAKITLRSGLQWKCSDPLLAFNDCRKCSGSAVGNGTQRKPALFAVKKFAVQIEGDKRVHHVPNKK